MGSAVRFNTRLRETVCELKRLAYQWDNMQGEQRDACYTTIRDCMDDIRVMQYELDLWGARWLVNSDYLILAILAVCVCYVARLMLDCQVKCLG